MRGQRWRALGCDPLHTWIPKNAKLCEQSRKLKVHKNYINKFMKVPSLTTCLHKNDAWQIWGCRFKENDVCVCACAQVWHKLQRGYRCLGRSHRLPHVCKMYENQCPSLPMTSKFPIADVFAVVHVNQWQRAVFQLPLYNTTACSSALAVKITTSPSCRQLARQSWDILNQTRDSCLPSICTARCESSFGVNLPCFRSIFKHTEQVIELGPERQKF